MTFRRGPILARYPGTTMEKVNLFHSFTLGNINRLQEIRADDPADRWMHTINVVQIYLENFITFSRDELPQSCERASALNNALSGRTEARMGKPIRDQDLSVISGCFDRFETSLEDELGRRPTFAVQETGAYSFGVLVGAAEKVFHERDRTSGLISESVVLDFRSAGSCLAFDLGTACGFHVCRATDAMLQKYCNHFQGVLKGAGRDWGKYIKALRDVIADTGKPKKPNERTVELIDNIRALDRNPLVHPEQSLDKEEALELFDLCKNVISLMCRDIKERP